MNDGPWTLERVAAARAELAPLARLHRALADAAREDAEADAAALPFAGVPALYWLEGRPLLDAVDRPALAVRAARGFGAAARAAARAFPQARAPLDELAAATSDPAFQWLDRVARFREVPEGTPHGALFRFLLLRALSAPARCLAATVSAPHPGRWIPAACPWCGVPAAAAVARQGSGRTLVCVLCTGRWERDGLECLACGEDRQETRFVLADRALGPASLEACGSCRGAIKVFAAADVAPDAPAETLLALEVLTVHLDVLAERENLRRDEVALASLYPPP